MFKIFGMNCISCKLIVEKQLKNVQAVKNTNLILVEAVEIVEVFSLFSWWVRLDIDHPILRNQHPSLYLQR